MNIYWFQLMVWWWLVCIYSEKEQSSSSADTEMSWVECTHIITFILLLFLCWSASYNPQIYQLESKFQRHLGCLMIEKQLNEAEEDRGAVCKSTNLSTCLSWILKKRVSFMLGLRASSAWFILWEWSGEKGSMANIAQNTNLCIWARIKSC